MKTVTAAEMRELDRKTIEERGVPGRVLMDRAGLGVARRAADILPRSPNSGGRVRVIAGGGNNGGDAFVTAGYLHEWGFDVELILAKPESELKGDARHHYGKARSAALSISEVLDASEWQGMGSESGFEGLIVDGLLGTGTQGAPRGAIAAAIKHVNLLAESNRVISIDIPSGLDANTGLAPGAAVKADLTISMACPKRGLLMPEAVDYVGRLEVLDIGIEADPNAIADNDYPEFLAAREARGILARRRKRDMHKGRCGRVLVIGGARGYSGAVSLAARAALRSGAGLVTVLTPESIVPTVSACNPEIMVCAAAETRTASIDHSIWSEWERRSADFDAILLGPGLTRSDSSLRLVRDVLRDSEVPLVLDADAIAVLEGGAHWIAKCRAPVVITPHPGEMALLLMKDLADLQSARWDCAREASELSEATVVLKGAGTCIAMRDHPLLLNLNGNPGMATGGSGDVLGGMIAALIAQGFEPCDAANAGVFMHGRAGDRAAGRLSESGMIAGDLIEELPLVIRELAGR